MLNCIEATRLISESHERPLTFSEKIQLSFHLMMCSGCRAFKANSQKLRELTRRHNQPNQSKQHTTENNS